MNTGRQPANEVTSIPFISIFLNHARSRGTTCSACSKVRMVDFLVGVQKPILLTAAARLCARLDRDREGINTVYQ